MSFSELGAGLGCTLEYGSDDCVKAEAKRETKSAKQSKALNNRFNSGEAVSTSLFSGAWVGASSYASRYALLYSLMRCLRMLGVSKQVSFVSISMLI